MCPNDTEFVCIEVLRPSQPDGAMSSAVSLPNHTFTGQTQSSKRLTSIVHILLPETDNCPSWISGRERMTVENITWSKKISTKECCRPSGGWTHNLLITSQMCIQCIQLSHWGTSIRWLCMLTVKALIRLHGSASWAEPLLSAFNQKAYFHIAWLITFTDAFCLFFTFSNENLSCWIN